LDQIAQHGKINHMTDQLQTTDPSVSPQTQTSTYAGSPVSTPRAQVADPPSQTDYPRGWNWGGFLLTWIWGIGNRTYVSFLSLIPGLGLLVAIFLGIRGNEWAWKNRRFESAEQFIKVQKIWSIWGLVLAAISLLFFMFFVIVLSSSKTGFYSDGRADIDNMFALEEEFKGHEELFEQLSEALVAGDIEPIKSALSLEYLNNHKDETVEDYFKTISPLTVGGELSNGFNAKAYAASRSKIDKNILMIYRGVTTTNGAKMTIVISLIRDGIGLKILEFGLIAQDYAKENPLDIKQHEWN